MAKSPSKKRKGLPWWEVLLAQWIAHRVAAVGAYGLASAVGKARRFGHGAVCRDLQRGR